MSFPFGRTRLRFRKVCQLLSRTCILTHVSSSILRRLRLTALTTRYSVSDAVRLQTSNFQELHHLSIHKCIATSRLVKVCTFLTTLIPLLVDLPPKKINESSRALVLDFRFYLFAFLRCIFFFLIFFKFALLMTIPQPAHLCDATEHLQLCTDLMSLFRSCNSTFFFTFFCLAASYFFRLFFFSNFALSMTALMLIRTVLQSAHLSDATEYLQPCTILMSFYWSCKRTSTFLFFLSEQPRCLKHTA